MFVSNTGANEHKMNSLTTDDEASGTRLLDSFGDEDTRPGRDDTRLEGGEVNSEASSSNPIHPYHNQEETSASSSADLELQVPTRLTTQQRILNVVSRLLPIKQTYDRINNGLTTGRMQTNTPGRFIGLGTDGVFRNLAAKPDTDENLHLQEQHPPTYEEAAADSAPEYWETTIASPMCGDEVFVEGLPVGDMASFAWNALVAVAFQYVGFVLCYLLHTSHAAKHGSRAGLGVTLVMAGSAMIPSNFGHLDKVPPRYIPHDANKFDISQGVSVHTKTLDDYDAGLFKQFTDELSQKVVEHTPYFAYGVVAFGLFMILKSLVDYYRVKKMELLILVPPGVPVTTSLTEESENANRET